MLVVSAVMMAAEGKGDDLEKEFLKLIPQVREKEEGTLTYIVHRGLQDPSKFLVYEQYRAREDLDAHAATPYFKDFMKATADLVAGRPEITFYRKID